MHSTISLSEPTHDYEVIQRVGIGSFGEVYKARHVRTKEPAAIKIVKLESGDNFAVIQQEILLLRECVHPNIISYYASYIRKDRLWIVMEYCQGGSLQDIYQLSGPLLELQIAFVCRETLKGLEYLHKRGKIHRDIKGANILLTHNGDVKLADFGVAAQITATLGKRNSFIGTPYWMAPEVAAVEKRGGYSTECDVWAVGITAIELAEMQPPLFDLQPMQVLYLMTRKSYKPPKLKDKKKWSPAMHDFVKNCLIINVKKRPSPEKLLTTHPFVKGALSSRLTRELLDKINNSGRTTTRTENHTPTPEDDSFCLSNEISLAMDDITNDYHQRKPSIDSESSNDSTNQQNIQITRQHIYVNERPPPISKSNPNGFNYNDDLDSLHTVSCVGTIYSSTSEHGGILSENSTISAPPLPPHPQVKRRKFRLENVFRFPTNSLKLKVQQRSASLGSPLSIRNDHIKQEMLYQKENEPLTERPTTFYGLPPTPKVQLGACFTSIFHNCNLTINCVTTWIYSVNNRQYAIIGTDEGIYMLDLYELHEGQMILVYQTRCLWLYVIDDIIMSLQGKTPYLYRHDLSELIRQELIMTKISKKITKVPELLKPKSLSVTIRLPETKDCIQCTVKRSVYNDNLYLCCATPDSMILYQWYEPQKKFVNIKSHEFDKLTKLTMMKPFTILFGNGPNCDYPQICYGVYKKQQNNDDDDGYDLQILNFNDHGKLEDLLSNSTDIELVADTLRPYTSRRFKFDNNLKLDIVTMDQLEKDSIMMAYDNNVVIIGMDGMMKKPDMIKTKFNFDFKIDFALALSDSVLAFHKHGVQGRSFFNLSMTQHLNDETKIYEVLCHDPIVILSSKPVNDTEKNKEESPEYSNAPTMIYETLKSDDMNKTLTNGYASNMNGGSGTMIERKPSLPVKPGVDLCILTGHVSTIEDSF